MRRGVSFLARVLLALTTAAIIATCGFMEVSSNSMEPTLHQGDLILVCRIGWLPRYVGVLRLTRTELVVFRPAGEQAQVKRLIGLPGDRVRLSRGQLILNGSPVAEPYMYHRAQSDGPDDSWPKDPNASGTRDVLVPSQHYFLLGDNRDVSFDSRHRGMFADDAFVGVVALIWRRSN